MKYFTIYKITNNITGQYYIGKHITNNPNDGYMGSGKYIKRAIEKHGISNFTKEIVSIYDNEHDMNIAEEFTVNLSDPKSYNLQPGGQGGWHYINSNNLANTTELKEKKSETMRSYWTDDLKDKKSRDMIEYNKLHGTERYSIALNERYKDSEYYEKFKKKMCEVNSREDKRLDASEKIKEKWKDPVFIDKMSKRPHGSNSNTMKEKWKDPVFKQMMLDRRKKTHETNKDN